MSPSLAGMKRRLMGHVQQGGIFQKVDLRSGLCYQSVWEGVAFEDSQLSMVNFVNSRWSNSHLTRTTLYGANFNASSLRGMVLDGCDMEQTSFAAAVLEDIVFRNCRLAYSSFVGATLHNVLFESCNCHGMDADYAVATGVQYSRSSLWGVKSAFGCTWWNSGFGVEDCQRFAALLARVHPDPASKEILVKLAGEATYRAVDRLMRPESDGPEF